MYKANKGLVVAVVVVVVAVFLILSVFDSPNLRHCLKKPPVLMFLLVSTPLNARELVKTMTSTRDISRFRKEKLVSRVIPPHGSMTS